MNTNTLIRLHNDGLLTQQSTVIAHKHGCALKCIIKWTMKLVLAEQSQVYTEQMVEQSGREKLGGYRLFSSFGFSVFYVCLGHAGNTWRTGVYVWRAGWVF